MEKRILIDAVYAQEIRVVVHEGEKVLDYETESPLKRPVKGNIYLAKITRVEPSLQAAFVDYGADRHGFLPFSEIHPDYFQLPVSDREQLVKAAMGATKNIDEDHPAAPEQEGDIDLIDGDDGEEPPQRPRLHSDYNIQEVVKRGQVLLIQAIKEERGNKGAALTTYISLAGRYCVLMPNSAQQGGISRRIADPEDRKRLKAIINSIEMPPSMSVIVRTAGGSRSDMEVKRDFTYLLKLWESIRDHTIASTAPTFVHAEGDLIKRTLRDLYNDDIEEVLVEGEQAYRTAKDFMKMLMPRHAGKIKSYRSKVPLFTRFKVEDTITKLYDPVVQLESGGYIVLHPTEALVSVDVNSGRATSERNIEETALKTNLEAARATAKQLRMRDLSGLVVIDFIDMSDHRNRHMVERELKDALRVDRAKIQVGRISHFGLLELSRQRLRANLVEVYALPCTHCHGTGHVRAPSISSTMIFRSITREAQRSKADILEVTAASSEVSYILNYRRDELQALEKQYNMDIVLLADDTAESGKCRFEKKRRKAGSNQLTSLTEQTPISSLIEEETEEGQPEDSAVDRAEDRAEERVVDKREDRAEETSPQKHTSRQQSKSHTRKRHRSNHQRRKQKEEEAPKSIVQGFLKRFIKEKA